MKFTLFSTFALATLAVATPAPKKAEKGFQVVIKYVDAPDCDYQCGTNKTAISTESTTTITSTRTHYVVVTLQTNYGTTSTVACTTGTEPPIFPAAPTYAPEETAAPEPEPTY